MKKKNQNTEKKEKRIIEKNQRFDSITENF